MSHTRKRTLLIGLLLATLVLALPDAQPSAAQTTPPTWRDTPVTLTAPSLAGACIDGSQPGVLLINEAEGTVSYDWRTNARTIVNPRQFERCGVNGTLYAANPDGSALRFSTGEPTGRTIGRMPTYLATDGTTWVYAIGDGRVQASPDGGLTWQQRAALPGGAVEVLALAPADARAIYALTASGRTNTTTGAPVRYTIYFSPDAGVTWDQRYTAQENSAGPGFPSFALDAVPGGAPVTAVRLTIRNGSGSGSPARSYLSTDGARTFTQLPSGLDVGAQVVGSNEGLVTQSYIGRSYSLALTPYGGTAVQPLPRPPVPPSEPGTPPQLLVVDEAPANLLLADSGNSGLWYSPDSGRSWAQLATEGRERVLVTPYLPLTLLSLRNGTLQALDLPDAGDSQTRGTVANGAAGDIFFSQTSHNASHLFVLFWDANGGLAQFGYPRTEAFREVSDTDGKVYVVQYFERNRFEYHPENAGTSFEVLLGLLGNQLTQERRAAGEAPFAPVPLPSPLPSDARYFTETNHTLSGRFLNYWNSRGGLAIYGLPISEPFQEVNQEDGKSYTVQYFERARFEYHPELASTQYEVLLGLLGNTLLREKGWLP